MWYVAATKAREEERALRNLTQQGFCAFLPMMERTVRHARRTALRTIPLFPGYVFIDGTRAARWRSVNGTKGITRLIVFSDRPAIVEPGFVEELIKLSRADGVIDLKPRLSIGARVEFAAGPMAQRIGHLLSLDDRGRATVLLRFLLSEVRVKTDAGNLLPA
ncbi:MAG: transcriptional activator RfaH [Rhizobiales bacterium]|jgi:transcriptional antiterminator RfaH|nr:transcriptional activator RfaH [Hyphomicrobiales bacterium]